ncbi:adenylate/guanylate cyclase domain-containing protein [Mycobacterium sp. CBMA293]|uniref:adenylate/guanylate cyclase domain-containing protein n=2 Tax=Mycolicibacterium TaxID=1866885 RepID=UPI0012DE29A2|nr:MULTISPECIES: adenylate/guanylate cyclase domain-containing protein [unclassified Mycolicibacterium]MUL48148.1 adenylate/guanylate cyclase domain-containing protein [Mycolicibacterium sp. CBMA 360]MUL57684.1 adenylate/guanylate cyclase domain-containing protein [Mycolicibacterium sp. CBMA 335]MUL70724.1 adenylate/guanylate cyclase domain-containing protein [Mycolicibacterium sp. CBMA 311]MUL92772.1 adenylate/guanylate cyclase domain-containing protein [Mycolicibacterium sp. CBMA 230]MUM0821
MDRIFQWVWDRYGPRYSWAICVLIYFAGLSVYLAFPLIIVAFERSDRYAPAAAIAFAAMVVRVYFMVLPGSKGVRPFEKWAAGHDVDPMEALHATFTYARGTNVRVLATDVIWAPCLGVLVGAILGAPGWRLVQYAIVGAVYGAAVGVFGVHSFTEGSLRPVRAAIAGDTGIGDSLPRSRPTFAAWTTIAMFSLAFGFSTGAALIASVIDRSRHDPVVSVVIGVALMLIAGPVAVMATAPFLRPIRDLAEGTKRVAAGDYSQRLPVVQDDDLGALSASFNRMQAGLVERQRLQAAFGTYVDPALAARLLEQGDDVFTGERREVTVMFIDIRDFTPFAEANTAEVTVAHLNTLFEIVVPAVVGVGGHLNKFLGDGAMVVFGAPNDLERHADTAVRAAVAIQCGVAERFGGALRIGIGINTGVVIAGTIGCAGHLEFTLIGDTVNVASRVEQFTKTTGDAILLTHQTVEAMLSRPVGLIDRGAHALKGKSTQVQIFGLAVDDSAARGAL